MTGSMGSMPGGRRCRFEPEEEDIYDSEEEARIVYALKEGRTVAAPLSNANSETVDSLDSTDSSPEKPGSGLPDNGQPSSDEA